MSPPAPHPGCSAGVSWGGTRTSLRRWRRAREAAQTRPVCWDQRPSPSWPFGPEHLSWQLGLSAWRGQGPMLGGQSRTQHLPQDSGPGAVGDPEAGREPPHAPCHLAPGSQGPVAASPSLLSSGRWSPSVSSSTRLPSGPHIARRVSWPTTASSSRGSGGAGGSRIRAAERRHLELGVAAQNSCWDARLPSRPAAHWPGAHWRLPQCFLLAGSSPHPPHPPSATP